MSYYHILEKLVCILISTVFSDMARDQSTWNGHQETETSPKMVDLKLIFNHNPQQDYILQPIQPNIYILYVYLIDT